MAWTVNIARKVVRQLNRLPEKVREKLVLLTQEIESYGPVRGNWPNYSALPGNQHHCHLKKGRPTYVAVWEVADNKIQIAEVIYAGTHEKAPY